MRNRVLAGLFLGLLACLPAAAAPQCAQGDPCQGEAGAMGGDAWDHTTAVAWSGCPNATNQSITQ